MPELRWGAGRFLPQQRIEEHLGPDGLLSSALLPIVEEAVTPALDTLVFVSDEASSTKCSGAFTVSPASRPWKSLASVLGSEEVK